MDSRVILSVPKEYMKQLNSMGQWVHGFSLAKMNPCVTKDIVKSHFEKWGVVIFCDVKTECTMGFPRGLGYVGFSSEEEADAVEAAGPHKLAGMEVDIRRVISPKTYNMTYIPHTRNSVGISGGQHQEGANEDIFKTENYTKYVSHRRATLETSGDITYKPHRRSDVGVDLRRIVSPMQNDDMVYVSHRRHTIQTSGDATDVFRRHDYEWGSFVSPKTSHVTESVRRVSSSWLN